MRWPEGHLRRSDASGGWAPRTLAGGGGGGGGTAGRQAPALHVPAWGVRCALLLGVPTAQAPQGTALPPAPESRREDVELSRDPGPPAPRCYSPGFLEIARGPGLGGGQRAGRCPRAGSRRVSLFSRPSSRHRPAVRRAPGRGLPRGARGAGRGRRLPCQPPQRMALTHACHGAEGGRRRRRELRGLAAAHTPFVPLLIGFLLLFVKQRKHSPLCFPLRIIGGN